MKKSNFWKLLSGTVFFATVALASCVDDNDDKGMPYLEVTPDVLTFNADGAPEGASAFTVKSNRPWTLEVLEGSDWVTPSATQGSGDGTVEFTIPASNVGRIAKLSFNLKNAYGAYWTKEVTIEQGEAPKAGEVSALVAYIKNTWPSLESGTEELNYSQKTIPAVILANNEGGNNFGKLYVGDNITLPNSAIILYSTTEFTRDNSAKYPVGKKVTLDLSAAQYAPYGNLRELKNVVVTVSDDPAVEVAVPTLSAATLNEGNYQGQYVRVTNLTPQSSFVGEAWATSAKRVVRFDAAGGETVQSYMATATDAAGFAAITIADKTGALLGTAEQNFKNIQVIPTMPSDVAAFVASGASLSISPEDNLVLGSASGATATVTVTANIAWTATMSGDGFTISPQGGDNNGTVTVTATAANETSASKDLGSITFSGEGVTPLTLRVAQAAKPSAEPKTVAQFVAFVKGLAPASGAEASLGEWTGQTVQGYIAANDAGGNLYQMISVVDNTGDAGSGILLADAAYETVADYPVGARITLTLDATSTVYNSYGLYKINKVTTAVDNSSPVQMVVPSVTLAQFNSNDYMGMNVKVTGLAFKGEAGEMWYSGTANYSTRLFTDGSGDLAVRTYKTVAWGGEWVLWGDHTAAYTYGADVDPRAIFDVSMRMLMHITNDFQREWSPRIDEPMTRALKDEIINREQEKLDGYVSMGALLEGSEQRLQAVENNLNTYIWSIVLLREFQVLLSFDELYMYLEQPLMAKYISYFARRSRKYNACIGVATQQLQDCLDESVRRYSSPIINMSSFKFLFYSGQVDLQDMKEALKLTDGEAACISVSNKRHCLLKAGNGKYYMEVGTLPFEAELFGDKGGI